MSDDTVELDADVAADIYHQLVDYSHRLESDCAMSGAKRAQELADTIRHEAASNLRYCEDCGWPGTKLKVTPNHPPTVVCLSCGWESPYEGKDDE